MFSDNFDDYMIDHNSLIFSQTGGGYWQFDDVDSVELLDDEEITALVFTTPREKYLIECYCKDKDDEEFYVAPDALSKILQGWSRVSRCPICGCTAHAKVSDGGKWFMTCVYCPLETKATFDTEEEAIDFWNERG